VRSASLPSSGQVSGFGRARGAGGRSPLSATSSRAAARPRAAQRGEIVGIARQREHAAEQRRAAPGQAGRQAGRSASQQRVQRRMLLVLAQLAQQAWPALLPLRLRCEGCEAGARSASRPGWRAPSARISAG
jgi:hypothetical protein